MEPPRTSPTRRRADKTAVSGLYSAVARSLT